MGILIVLFAFLFVLLVGLFLAALMAGFVALVISFGIITIAAITAWYHSSASKGIEWLFRLVFAVGGMMGGVLGCFVYKLIWPTQVPLFAIIMIGLITGTIGGYFTGKLAFSIVRRVFRHYRTHLPDGQKEQNI